MTNQDKRDLINRYINAYNAFDIDGMMAIVHPEIKFKNITGGEVNAEASGVDEFRQMAEQSKELFSSREQEISEFTADGNEASIHINYEAVLASDLPNGMKKGETLKLNGRSEFRFMDGKISSITDYS